MARGKNNAPRRRPVDLIGILSVAEKDALIVLANDIVDKIHGQISAVFDSPVSTAKGGASASYDDNEWSHISAAIIQNRAAANQNNRPLTDTPEAPKMSQTKAHQLLVQEEKEAMTPQLAELKKEALVLFSKWQASVVFRVADLDICESPAPARGGRGGRGGAARGRNGSVRSGRAQPSAVDLPPPVMPASLGPSHVPPVSQRDPAFHARYAPTATPLWQLPLERRKIILHIMFLLVLSLEEYSTFNRALLINLASSLDLAYRAFQEEEVRVARAFSKAIQALALQPEDDAKATTNGPDAPKAPAEPRTGRKKGTLTAQDMAANINTFIGPLLSAGVGSVVGSNGSNNTTIPKTTVVNLLGPIIEAPTSIGGFFGVFGAIGPNGPRPMSRSLEQFSRDVQDFALLPLSSDKTIEYRDPLQIAPHDRRMRVVFAIGGWTSPDDEQSEADTTLGPWKCLGRQSEAYAVRWDLAARDNLGNALETASRSKAWEFAKRDILSRSSELEQTIKNYLLHHKFGHPGKVSGSSRYSGSVVAETSDTCGSNVDSCRAVFSPSHSPQGGHILPSKVDARLFIEQELFLAQSVSHGAAKGVLMYSAVLGTMMEVDWPLNLLRISKILDNPWHIGMVRAEKAGYALAEAISRRIQGARPVSLVGYSLGARAIYTCLMILAERRQLNLVDSVVMMGTPAPSESRVWLTLKSVVTGRLINVYSEADYLLAFLYRTSNVQFGLAGLQAVQAEGVENFNVGDLSAIGGHMRYKHMVATVLRDIGWDDLDRAEVQVATDKLAALDAEYDAPPAPVGVMQPAAPLAHKTVPSSLTARPPNNASVQVNVPMGPRSSQSALPIRPPPTGPRNAQQSTRPPTGPRNAPVQQSNSHPRSRPNNAPAAQMPRIPTGPRNGPHNARPQPANRPAAVGGGNNALSAIQVPKHQVEYRAENTIPAVAVTSSGHQGGSRARPAGPRPSGNSLTGASRPRNSAAGAPRLGPPRPSGNSAPSGAPRAPATMTTTGAPMPLATTGAKPARTTLAQGPNMSGPLPVSTAAASNNTTAIAPANASPEEPTEGNDAGEAVAAPRRRRRRGRRGQGRSAVQN